MRAFYIDGLRRPASRHGFPRSWRPRPTCPSGPAWSASATASRQQPAGQLPRLDVQRRDQCLPVPRQPLERADGLHVRLQRHRRLLQLRDSLPRQPVPPRRRQLDSRRRSLPTASSSTRIRAFRGREEINLDNTEGSSRGPLQERASYWFFVHLGFQYSTQEWVLLIVNGTQHGQLSMTSEDRRRLHRRVVPGEHRGLHPQDRRLLRVQRRRHRATAESRRRAPRRRPASADPGDLPVAFRETLAPGARQLAATCSISPSP